MLNRLKDEAIKRAFSLMGDPRVAKVLSNPKLMGLVMQALQARGKAKDDFDKRVAWIAAQLGLATRAEVRELKATLRAMEAKLAEMRAAAEGDDEPRSDDEL